MAGAAAPLNLSEQEYGSVMEALEAAVTGRPVTQKIRNAAWKTWARLMVDGGHVDAEEFKELKQRYAPTR